MPYADFDKTTHPATTDSFVGGPEGTARFHSVLTNPLVGEDLFCREYKRAVQIGAGRGQFYLLNDPAFIGIPATKKVSLRAWVRRQGSFSTDIGLIARSGVGAGPSPNAQVSGYRFKLGDNGDPNGNDTVAFKGHDAVASAGSIWTINQSGGQANLAEPNFGGFTNNLWHKIRMDILPLGPGADEVRFYRGTGATGSEVWALLHTAFFSSSDAWWVPHDHVTSNRYGFYIGQGNTANLMLIDRFQIFLEDV